MLPMRWKHSGKGHPHAPVLTVYARPNAEPDKIYIAKWGQEYVFKFTGPFSALGKSGQALSLRRYRWEIKLISTAVIADIESAIAENGVRADVAEWIAEAESLAKTITIAELNRRCPICMVVFRLLSITNICRIVEGVLK